MNFEELKYVIMHSRSDLMEGVGLIMANFSFQGQNLQSLAKAPIECVPERPSSARTLPGRRPSARRAPACTRTRTSCRAPPCPRASSSSLTSSWPESNRSCTSAVFGRWRDLSVSTATAKCWAVWADWISWFTEGWRPLATTESTWSIQCPMSSQVEWFRFRIAMFK